MSLRAKISRWICPAMHQEAERAHKLSVQLEDARSRLSQTFPDGLRPRGWMRTIKVGDHEFMSGFMVGPAKPTGDGWEPVFSQVTR